MYRTILPIPSTPANTLWTKVVGPAGSQLPNVYVSDIRYDSTDNLLSVATLGRGVFVVRNASQEFDDNDVLRIDGDESNDVLRLRVNPLVSGAVDVFFNNTTILPNLIVDASTLRRIEFAGSGGTDTLEIDVTNGLIVLPGKIEFTGGAGTDSVRITGVAANTLINAGALMLSAAGQRTIVNWKDQSGTEAVVFAANPQSASEALVDQAGLLSPQDAETDLPFLEAIRDGLLHTAKWSGLFSDDGLLGTDLPVVGSSLGRTLSGSPAGPGERFVLPSDGLSAPALPLSDLGQSIVQRILEMAPAALPSKTSASPLRRWTICEPSWTSWMGVTTGRRA
jgi:hypothetical protein